LERDDLKALIKQYAEKYGLDPAIVFGICVKESGLNPKDPPEKWRFDSKATRFEPTCKYYFRFHIPGVTDAEERHDQATSWGLMQVLGVVLRELGYRGILPDILDDIDAQIEYGCRHLLNKISKYGLELGIASYNSGSPRYKNGKLANADYLKKVLNYAKGWADVGTD
jgi:soluble lytic murein transglycosylase-like protein